MNVTAISPIARVAAPYAAHIARVDDTRPSWEAERLAKTVAAREAHRTKRVHDFLDDGAQECRTVEVRSHVPDGHADSGPLEAVEQRPRARVVYGRQP